MEQQPHVIPVRAPASPWCSTWDEGRAIGGKGALCLCKGPGKRKRLLVEPAGSIGGEMEPPVCEQ